MAEVLYCTNIDAMSGFGDYKPQLKEYKKVCEIDGDPDFIFSELNINPRKYIKYPLPKGVIHTSMSVGDIVKTGGKYLMCAIVGWDEVNVK